MEEEVEALAKEFGIDNIPNVPIPENVDLDTEIKELEKYQKELEEMQSQIDEINKTAPD